MRLTQEQAEAADAEAIRFENAKSKRKSDLRILDLLDQLRDTTARAEQAEKRAPNWDHLSTISNFTEGCECAICTGEMLLEAVDKHSLVLSKQQAEKEKVALAEACQKGVDIIESLIPESIGNDDADEVLGEMRAAIAKAKGGTT